MTTIKELLNRPERFIAIWGYPEPTVLNEVQQKYPNHYFIDLDINYNAISTGIIPEAYCKIIKNLINNSFALRDKIDLIVASTGEEKCDSGRFAYKILKDTGFNIISATPNAAPNLILPVIYHIIKNPRNVLIIL